MSGLINTSKLNNPPEEHELNVANYFSALGYDIGFIPPSNIPNFHAPDIIMDGIEWEIKSPQGKGKHTIERNISNALLQSRFIIIDLSRITLNENDCLKQINKEFNIRKQIKKLYIITKEKELIVLKR